MALKIVRSCDPLIVKRLNLCIYSPPGLGKTSLAFTAEAPLLLDFDRGAYRAANRGDSVQVEKWADVTELTEEDLAPYKTVVVDTAGRALDSLTAHIIKTNPKAGRGGALTLQGYGTLKAEFVAWLKLLNSLGKDVLLLAHMDEQRNGDELIERLDVQGGSKGEIYKAADAMGRISIKEGKRMLNFSPSDAAFGKNPGQLDPLQIPHPSKDGQFLAGIIKEIKAKLNALSEAQTASQEAMQRWRETVEAMESVEDFNIALPQVKKEDTAIRAMFNNAAKDRGYAWDQKVGKYTAEPNEKEAA